MKALIVKRSLAGILVWALAASTTLAGDHGGDERPAAPAPDERGVQESLLVQELLASRQATRAQVVQAVAAYSGMEAGLDDMGPLMDELHERHILTRSDLRRLDRDEAEGKELPDGLTRPATRGFACLVFRRAMGIHPSIMGKIFPRSEHYAYRGLERLALIPGGGASTGLSGVELVGLWRSARARGPRKG